MAEAGPRLGLSTASYFNRMSIEDAAADIGAHGVRIVELFLNSFCEYTEEFAALLRARLDAAGVACYSVHPMSTQFEPQLFSAHPRQRADAFRLYEQVLAAGRTLGASHYTMHGAANLAEAARYLPVTRVAPVFSDLIALAKEYGITLTLENVSWCQFRTPEYGARLLDATGGALRFTLDVKQAVRSGFDPLDYIEAVGDAVENLHLCDACAAPEGGGRWTLPGRGTIDFESVWRALAAHGYAGPAFLEVYSDTYGALSELYDALDLLRDRLELRE